MRRLHNMTQAYDWGSTSDIPRFLGRTGSGEPVAEMWLGTHPLAPSQVETSEGLRPLSDVAGDVPFMLKILAAEQPLSIQVHPNADEARAGFDREEAAGIPLESPQRVFKDTRHKPEMVYALSTFDTLVGFRPTAEILRVFAQLDSPAVNAASADALSALWERQRARDQQARTTLAGPHRDDFDFTLAGRPAREFASEGQQRSLVLALRLAQVAFFQVHRGVRPVVLADDVLGELDPERRRRFWGAVGEGCQVIASGTSLPDAALGDWQILTVEAGRVTEAAGGGRHA